MNLPQILRQLQYKQWADKRTLEAVAPIATQRVPSEKAFACQQLNHMVRVEEVFRARLQDSTEPHANSEVVPSPGEWPAGWWLPAKSGR